MQPPLRCVIANMPQQLLVDIFEDIVDECVDIEIVNRVSSVSDIQAVMAAGPVDLVVLGMKSAEIPESWLGLMNQPANVAIVGLIDDGRRMAAFVDDIGKNDILKLIRTISRTEPEERS